MIELNDGRILERFSKPQKMGNATVGRVWSYRDITDQKRAEETLRRTSQYLENLINYANAPIIVWDPKFRITRFNHAFERLTGRMAPDVIGESISILFPEPQQGELMRLIRKTSAGERWNDVELPILTTSGEIRTVLWNSATLSEPDGKTISSVIAQGQDITARKQADETARKTLSLLNAALDSTADGLLVVDPEGKITSYNQNFATMWNIPQSALATLEENSSFTTCCRNWRTPQVSSRALRISMPVPEGRAMTWSNLPTAGSSSGTETPEDRGRCCREGVELPGHHREEAGRGGVARERTEIQDHRHQHA